jgi:hypothetical protein
MFSPGMFSKYTLYVGIFLNKRYLWHHHMVSPMSRASELHDVSFLISLNKLKFQFTYIWIFSGPLKFAQTFVSTLATKCNQNLLRGLKVGPNARFLYVFSENNAYEFVEYGKTLNYEKITLGAISGFFRTGEKIGLFITTSVSHTFLTSWVPHRLMICQIDKTILKSNKYLRKCKET